MAAAAARIWMCPTCAWPGGKERRLRASSSAAAFTLTTSVMKPAICKPKRNFVWAAAASGRGAGAKSGRICAKNLHPYLAGMKLAGFAVRPPLVVELRLQRNNVVLHLVVLVLHPLCRIF